MNPGPARRRLLIAGLAAMLASCATLPHSVEVSRAQIEAALARRFPLRAPASELLMVQVGVPRLDLLPDANRLRLTSAFDVSERITRRAMHGDIALSFALRYEPADATLRLADVQVERVDVQGVPQDWRRPAEAIAAYMGEHLLEGSVLHTFTPAQLARANGLRPGAIRVTPGGVSIELQPAP
jgi:hypothetical protein